jgi:hypothetical protein
MNTSHLLLTVFSRIEAGNRKDDRNAEEHVHIEVDRGKAAAD